MKFYKLLFGVLFAFSCDSKNDTPTFQEILYKHNTLWFSAIEENSITSFEKYLVNFPEGPYSYEAKKRIESIGKGHLSGLLDNLFKSQSITTYLLNESNRLNFKWYKVANNLFEIFPNSIVTENGNYSISTGSTQIVATQLNWSDDLILFRLADGNWGSDLRAFYYLLDKSRYIDGDANALERLNGTAPPIHEKNENTSISFTKSSGEDYLKFFCFFVWGEEGPFYLLESTSDPVILRYSDLFNEVKNHVKPVRSLGKVGSKLKYGAVVYYSNSLFDAEFTVDENGFVAMIKDTAVKTNLSAKMDVLIN